MNKIIDVSFPGGKTVQAVLNGYRVMTDQPETQGGKGSAPSPFQLFLSSIATCAGFYALQFCEARNLSTHGLTLRMQGDYDSESKRYKRLSIALNLPEGFPDHHRDSIIRAMNACAVKKHLQNPPEFHMEVFPAGSNGQAK